MNRIEFFRRALVTVALVAAAVIAGCAGEEPQQPEAGVGAGGTGPGTASVGAITGFGSIYVNGIRFDDDTADIRTDDGARVDRGQLDLGMWVEVVGTTYPGGAAGRADTVRVVRAVRGVVSRVELQKNEFRVLGAKVQVNSATVYGGWTGATGLAGVAVGDVVEVHGALDDRGDRIYATRVQRVAPGAPGQFSQRGRISALTPTTFVLGGLTVNFGAARIDAPVGLADGMLVTVIATAAPAANVLTAERVIAAPEFPPGLSAVILDGVVSRFDSLADLRIENTRVDATRATVLGGSPADIQLGARLLARGSLSQGKLVASEVIVLGATAPARPSIALGPITAFTSVSDFQVRGTRVDASAATFVNGNAASLAIGRVVQAQGTIDRGVLRATQVVIVQ